jgi:surface antigen/peptidoglycan hydrolase CwlO-like protein
MIKIINHRPFIAIAVLLVSRLGWIFTNNQPPVLADYYLCQSVKCKAAEAAEEVARAAQAEAAARKGDYQAEVDRFSAEIAGVQAAIDRTSEEIAELSRQIKNTERKIERLKESIKSAIVKMYLNENVSELEILASSSSVVDFTTKTANQAIIQDKVKQLALDAKQAKADLEQEKSQLEIKQLDQENQKAQSEALRAEQQEFVNKYAKDEEAYRLISEEQKIIKDQERTLIQESLGSGGGGGSCGGGYPAKWCNAPLDAYVDDWGLYTRECVSYTAFKVNQTYGNMPWFGGRGMAYQWVSTAQSFGIPTGSEPKVGSVGMLNWGNHVVWIEGLSGNTVYYSDYNRAGPGEYGTGSSPASYYTYIYFGDW